MNEIDILKELEKFDDDIEPGFLSELKQQTPDELHSRIMNSIRMEAMNSNPMNELGVGLGTVENEKMTTNVVELKPRFRFNYRKYATLTTAAAILIVVFVGGAKELLNQNITSDSISPKNGIVANVKVEKPTTKADANIATRNMLVENKVADTNPITTNNDKLKLGETTGDINKQNTSLTNKNKVEKSVAATTSTAVPKDTTATVPNKRTAKVGNAKTDAAKAAEEDSLTISTSKKIQPKGIIAAGTVTTTPIPNFTASNSADGKNNESTTTTDPSNLTATIGSDYKDANNSGIKAITDELKTASLENIVNYELNLNVNQNDIIQYINDKGTKLAENVYELKLTHYNELNQLLLKNSILPKKINELETNAQSVIVKMIFN